MARRRNLQVEKNRYYDFIQSKIPKGSYGYVEPSVFLEKILWMDEHFGLGFEDALSILELDNLGEFVERAKRYKENRSFEKLDKAQNELYSKSLKYLFEYRGLKNKDVYREVFDKAMAVVLEDSEEIDFQEDLKEEVQEEMSGRDTEDEKCEEQKAQEQDAEVPIAECCKIAEDAENIGAEEREVKESTRQDREDRTDKEEKDEVEREQNWSETQNIVELVEEQVEVPRFFVLADENKLIRFYKGERQSRRRNGVKWNKQNYWRLMKETLLCQFKDEPLIYNRAKNRGNLVDKKWKATTDLKRKQLTEIVSIKEPKQENAEILKIKAKIPDYIDEKNRKKGFALWLIFVKKLSSGRMTDTLKLMELCNELMQRFQICRSDIWDVESVEELESYYSMLEEDGRFRVINGKHFFRLQWAMEYYYEYAEYAAR